MATCQWQASARAYKKSWRLEDGALPQSVNIILISPLQKLKAISEKVEGNEEGGCKSVKKQNCFFDPLFKSQ